MNFKKILFTISLTISLAVSAQTYDFTITTDTYNNLSNNTSLNGTAPWDDPEFNIPIGFTFQYFDTNITSINIGDWGYGAELTTMANATGALPILRAYGADIADRGYDDDNPDATTGSLSTISYALEGTTGNRILKIEWENVGFYSEITENGTANDFTNFQLWLYEGSNTIEMHFGPNSIANPDLAYDDETGASIALMPAFNITTETILENATFLTGAPTSPTVISSTLTDTHYLNGIIPNGTVYKFTNSTLGINTDELTETIIIYPSPADNELNITNKSNAVELETITIINANGAVVNKLKAPSRPIDVSSLAPGIYFVKIETNAGVVIKKFSKI